MRKSNTDLYFIGNAVNRINEHKITAAGAQSAYFLLLMLFPFLLLVIAVLSFIAISTDDAVYFLSGVVPREVMQILGKYVEHMLGQRQGDILLVSAATSLWTASNVLNSFSSALNQAFEVRETRSKIKRVLLVIPFTFVLIFSIAAALMIPVLGKGFLILMSHYIRISSILINYLVYLRWLMAIFTLFNVILTIYYIAPNIRLRLSELLPGAVFATIGWLLTSAGFSLYFRTLGGSSIIYGSIGAVIILMIWLFWGAMIIMMGGELNAMLKEKRMFRSSTKRGRLEARPTKEYLTK